MAGVLIIDHERSVYDELAQNPSEFDHDIYYVSSLAEGISGARKSGVDVICLCEQLEGYGPETLAVLSRLPSRPKVIVTTNEGAADKAEMAIKSGVLDYVDKNTGMGRILPAVKRVLALRLSGYQSLGLDRAGIIGECQKIRDSLSLAATAASSRANVLITGETGTGKELFAKAIHENSQAKDHNFVVVDCASLPETLVESILFGHVKGAFTSADSSNEGLVKRADKGTLFLDEVAELPMTMQKKFLRVLQERKFLPVGGKMESSSDFRLVAATNKNMAELVEQGQFRSDLLYRLKSLSIELPALRERGNDTVKIAKAYVTKMGADGGGTDKSFSEDFVDALMNYDWPGNVRELLNCLDSALAVSGGSPELYPEHLPVSIRVSIAKKAYSSSVLPVEGFTGPVDSGYKDDIFKNFPVFKEYKRQWTDKIEKDYFHKLRQLTRKNIKRACVISRLSRARIYEQYKKYGIMT